MRKQLPLFATLVVLSLAGPLSAETAQSEVQDCLVAQATKDISDGCRALRTEFRAKVSACMTQRQINSEQSNAAVQGYKARYLLCDREVRDSLVLSNS